MSKLTIPAADFAKELTPGKADAVKKATGATTENMLMVDPSKITLIDGFNVRIDTPDYLAHVADVKASIKANGFYRNKPLAGYLGREGDENALLLTDGYTRYRAVMELIAEGVEIARVPFVPKPAGQTMEDLTIALIQDNEGRPLSVYERAIVVKRLSSYEMANAEIAEKLGITERYVGDLIVLAGAPAKVRNMVINGKVSATEAVKQLRKDGAKAAEKLAAAVAKAESEGKNKASAKDVKAAEEEGGSGGDGATKKSGVTMTVVTKGGKIHQNFTYRWKSGEIIPTDTMKVVRFLGGGEWWNFVDDSDKEHVVIEEDVEIKVTFVTKDTSPEAEKEEDEKTEDTTADTPALEAPETSEDEDDDGEDDENPPAAPAPTLEASEPSTADTEDDDEL